MENLFLVLGGLFAVGMLILMVKYAKFIHSQPSIAEERRKMKEEGPAAHEQNSDDNQ